MSTITIDKTIHTDLAKTSKLIGINEREITERALILYLDSLRNLSDLQTELHGWQDLGFQSLRSVEDMLNDPA
jgi:hypothetical protein